MHAVAIRAKGLRAGYMVFIPFIGGAVTLKDQPRSVYDDAQIGAAVRDIHRDCKKAVEKYIDLAPVLDEAEGGNVTVPAGFDPARIRLTGNVKGHPPFRGTVAHRGWRAKDVRVPPTDPGSDLVIAPAEVELS